MQSSKVYQYPCLNAHKVSFDFINAEKTLVSTQHPAVMQTSQKEHPAIQTLFSFSQKLSQDKTTLVDALQIQTEIHTSFVEDPLWKQVCADLIKMLGSFPTARIENCKLEDLSGHDKVANICCWTEDVAQFLEDYVFVILESLRQYFPTLKELRINNEGKINSLCAEL